MPINVILWVLQCSFKGTVRFIRQMLELPYVPLPGVGGISSRVLGPVCIILTLFAATTTCLLPKHASRIWIAVRWLIVVVITVLAVLPILAS